MSSLTTLPTIHAPRKSRIPTLNTFPSTITATPVANVIGAIPVPSSRVSEVQNGVVKPKFSIADELNDDGQEKMDIDEEYKLSHHLDLKQFKPSKLEQQLCELCITGFKDLSNETVELVLNEVIGEKEYKWSGINQDESRVVFVRFEGELEQSVKQVKNVMGVNGIVVNGMTLHTSVEQNTQDAIKEIVGDEEVKIEMDSLTEKIYKIIEKSKSRTMGNPTELDYVVDESELGDVPPEIVPQLKKDIRDFRLKALENEKKKREKEAVEDKRRAKLQLRKLFEKFRNETGQMNVDDDSDEEEDDDDGLTDEQYEELRIRKETQDMLRRYEIKLQSVHVLERRNAELVADFNELRNYESQLDKSMKPEYEHGKFKPSGRSKARELEADGEDREEEKHDEESNKKSGDFMASISIPLKAATSEEPSDSDTLNVDDKRLESILAELRPKINGYISESLGVEEDELADYIVSIVKDEKSKTKMLEELEEPLGEDASGFVEKLWADIIALV